MSERQEFTEDMNGFSEEDRQLERLLASLKPRESRVSRDRVMFLAGQASALVVERSRTWRLNRWVWPAATICSACAGLLIGASLGHVEGTPNPALVGTPRTSHDSVESVSPPRSSVAPEARSRLPVAGAMAVASEETETGNSQVGQQSSLLSLRNRMLAAGAEDPSQLGDSFRIAKRGARPLPSATYPQLLRQLLAEKS